FARRERDGRAWHYRAAANREAYVTELMLHALDQTGDRSAALTSFARRVSYSEAAVLRRALESFGELPRDWPHVFPPVLFLAALAAGTAPGPAALAAAPCAARSPGAAILLWQALGLSWGLAAVGALAALGAVPGEHGVAGGALSGAAGALRSAALGFGPPALMAAARLAVLA